MDGKVRRKDDREWRCMEYDPIPGVGIQIVNPQEVIDYAASSTVDVQLGAGLSDRCGYADEEGRITCGW
jgi:hypothetical protein